jgi:hypothetical protein
MVRNNQKRCSGLQTDLSLPFFNEPPALLLHDHLQFHFSYSVYLLVLSFVSRIAYHVDHLMGASFQLKNLWHHDSLGCFLGHNKIMLPLNLTQQANDFICDLSSIQIGRSWRMRLWCIRHKLLSISCHSTLIKISMELESNLYVKIFPNNVV